MKIIAHRANLNGPNLNDENQISSINKCIDLGFDVEIDVRLVKGKLYLGHDNPDKIITKRELGQIKNKLWIQIPLGLLVLWLLGFFNPYWCVYPVCWIN